ncbi:hypothetical protein [Streptococcus sp. zg-JUN1979]|uniref:hypothetical protein n=1 Tax=Streptococcus sp. zg-JUN1979 TaxID=3391450 RepID=UPI0039A66B49
MEQEQVAMKVADVYKVTGEFFLKSLLVAIEGGHDFTHKLFARKQFIGEAGWHQFLATDEEKHFETFLTSEVNSEQLKTYLKRYDVSYAIQENKDGTSTIAIASKNVKALEESFKGVINDLTSPDNEKAEELRRKLVKGSHNMSPSERVAYERQKSMQAQKGKVKGAVKHRPKVKGELER